MLSIIIPARTEKYLNKTISNVLCSASGEVELFVVLDGYGDYPYEPIDKVNYISFPLPLNNERRKRQAINTAVSLSHGKYICWLDAHCALSAGFDEKLIKDSEDDLVIVPSMYYMDLGKWDRMGEPENYRYWDFKSLLNNRLKQCRWDKKKDKVIDDIFCSQGSFFFMTRKWFDKCGFMDTKYMGWGSEGEEVCLTTLLNGGRVVVDKNTWYAHLSKDQMEERMYKYVTAQPSYDYAYNYWVQEHRDFFVETINKFMPIPNYPKNWEKMLYE